MTLRTFLLCTLTALAVSSCGGGTTTTAGGIGGTGVSYGPVTAFGSVIVNGTEYNTNSATFTKDGVSTTQAGLGVGMVVSVTHDNSALPNAKSVSFSDNAQGPVSNITVTDATTGAGTFTVLGITVTVNTLTVFSGNSTGLIGATPLLANDIVEVSGQLTGANAVTATRIEKQNVTCASAGLAMEVKGTASAMNANQHTFMIETQLVDYSAASPVASFSDGDYVEVKSATCPSSPGSALLATSIDLARAGANLSGLDHPDRGDLEVKGIVSGASGSATICTFTVNGQLVTTDSSTLFQGVDCTTLADGNLVEVHGQLNTAIPPVLLASQISSEDSGAQVGGTLIGAVHVTSRTSPFEGTITVGTTAGIVVGLGTLFEGDTQTLNLATFDTNPPGQLCAEVKITRGASPVAIGIHQEDCAP